MGLELGPVRRETRETRLQWMVDRAQARAQVPTGPEAATDQNKDNLNNTTTLQLEETLTACFEALSVHGPLQRICRAFPTISER